MNLALMAAQQGRAQMRGYDVYAEMRLRDRAGHSRVLLKVTHTWGSG